MVDPGLLNHVFFALSDPSRRQILDRLRESREATVTEIAAPLEMSLPAVSKHIRVLEQAGLLQRRRAGRTHFLTVEPGPMKEAQEWIEYQRRFWEGSFDRLAEYLDRPPLDTNKATKKKGKP